MAHEKLLMAWLKDAYSMEKGLIPVLENHAKDAKDFPQIQSRIQQHVEETRTHADRLKNAIESQGESVSAVKAAVGGVIGAVQSVATGPFKDELVKNALSDFAAENFEVASYKALIAAAQQVGAAEVVRVCEQNQREDEAMARWLDQNLPTAVRETVRQKEQEHSGR